MFNSNLQGGKWRSRTGFQAYQEMSLTKPLTDFPHYDGTLLKALKHEDLSVDELPNEVKIADCQLIASYNWLNKTRATIQIPGAPPFWMPPSQPITLKQDDGKYFRDENAARSPSFPMEAALRASLHMKPDLDVKAVDLCACSSTLGNLLRFAQGVKNPFRFWVEVIGKTAFLVRKERSPNELLEDVYGYGHTFPEMYTTWPQDVEGSESHQRIQKYKLANKTFMVRFEGDGYLRNLVDKKVSQQLAKSSGDAEKSLEDALSGLNQSNFSSPGEGEKLITQMGGRLIPQEATFDLKTRSIKKKDQDILSEEMPRLWIRQIPNFIIAFHRRGRFDDIEIKDIANQIKAWEHENQNELKKFVRLIDIILKEASAASLKKLEVRGTIEGVLELREVLEGQWSALPGDMHALWAEPEIEKKVDNDN